MHSHNFRHIMQSQWTHSLWTVGLATQDYRPVQCVVDKQQAEPPISNARLVIWLHYNWLDKTHTVRSYCRRTTANAMHPVWIRISAMWQHTSIRTFRLSFCSCCILFMVMNIGLWIHYQTHKWSAQDGGIKAWDFIQHLQWRMKRSTSAWYKKKFERQKCKLIVITMYTVPSHKTWV